MTAITLAAASQSNSLELAIFTIATLTAVVGFLSSATLYCYAKWRVRPNRTALRCLYQYASLFFGGTMLLCVDWMMGDRAPLPIRPPVDAQARVGFASCMICWALVCATAFMFHRMLRVLFRPDRSTPEGRNLVEARSAAAAGRLHGGRLVLDRRHRRGRHATTA